MSALADAILAAHGRRRTGPVVTDPTTALSSHDLVALARAEAADLRRLTARRSPTVAVTLPLSATAVVHLLAAILGDYTICFLDPAAPEARRQAVLASLDPDVLVDVDGGRSVATPREDRPEGHEPGYVAMSSGSTGGPPKGVLSPWSAIAAFAPAGADALQLDADAVWAEVSHPAYDMAMTNLLVVLASGARLHVSGTLGDRLRPLRVIRRVGATHVRLAPRYVDLAAAEARRAERTGLRVWASGGDRLHSSHTAQIFALGVPLVVNTYGTSETIGFASAALLRASENVPAVQGSVPIGRGTVGDWETGLVERGPDLMLSIRSPHLPQGYLFGEAGEFPRWEPGNLVITGDIGGRHGEHLFCLGRAGRRVKRNGSFVDLDVVDTAVRAAAGLTSFTLSTSEGELLTMVEAATKEELDGLTERLPSVLPPATLPDELVPVQRLPRLGNGKIDLAAAASLVSSRRHQPPPPPEQARRR